MSADNTSQEEQDQMAAEWAAALAESKSSPASEVSAPAESVAPASFTNFSCAFWMEVNCTLGSKLLRTPSNSKIGRAHV